MWELITSNNLEFWAKGLYWIGCGLAFASYAVRDMLLLRILAIGNCLLIAPYYLFVGEVSFEPIAMSSVIALINLVNTRALILERRPIRLNYVEVELRRKLFHRVKPRTMLEILAVGQWHEGESDEILIREHEVNSSIILIHRGEAAVSVGSQSLALIGDARFVGEMTYISGQTKASATVRLTRKTSYMSFSFDELDRLKRKSPDAYGSLFSILGVEMANKIAEGNHVMERQGLL